MARIKTPQHHSSLWLIQSWASFTLSLTALSFGILNLPVDAWVKGYMGMGTLFTVGSTLGLAKTSRDRFEEQQITARIDEAKVEKLLADHHPMN